MKPLSLALALTLLSATFTPIRAAAGSLAGDWVGTIEGMLILRMHLVEGPQGSVGGWVVMGSTLPVDSLEVLLGYHDGPDTLHL